MADEAINRKERHSNKCSQHNRYDWFPFIGLGNAMGSHWHFHEFSQIIAVSTTGKRCTVLHGVICVSNLQHLCNFPPLPACYQCFIPIGPRQYTVTKLLHGPGVGNSIDKFNDISTVKATALADRKPQINSCSIQNSDMHTYYGLTCEI